MSEALSFATLESGQRRNFNIVHIIETAFNTRVRERDPTAWTSLNPSRLTSLKRYLLL